MKHRNQFHQAADKSFIKEIAFGRISTLTSTNHNNTYNSASSSQLQTKIKSNALNKVNLDRLYLLRVPLSFHIASRTFAIQVLTDSRETLGYG